METQTVVTGSLQPLYNHLYRKSNDSSNACQSANRVSKLIHWIFNKKNGVALQDCNLLLFLESFLERDYLLIQEYCIYLFDPPVSSKPATIVTYLDNLSSAIQWFVFFQRNDGGDNVRRLTDNQIGGKRLIMFSKHRS